MVYGLDLTQDLPQELSIGYGSSSTIFKYNTGEEDVALSVQKYPTFNIDEIKLLIYLNKFERERLKTPHFSQFKFVLFDVFNLNYYICYKLYKKDLGKYLNSLLSDHSTKSPEIREHINIIMTTIENDLAESFEKLTEIDYICFDIKLANILVEYDNNDIYAYNHIVLHDHDLSQCCKKMKSTTCQINDKDKVYLLIYYKLIIFLFCIKQEPPNYTGKILFENFFKEIHSSILTDFLNFVMNQYVQDQDKHWDDFTLEEKIYYNFNHYILEYCNVKVLIPKYTLDHQKLVTLIKDIANRKRGLASDFETILHYIKTWFTLE